MQDSSNCSWALPLDLQLRVVQKIGWKEMGRLCCVSKQFKSLVRQYSSASAFAQFEYSRPRKAHTAGKSRCRLSVYPVLMRQPLEIKIKFNMVWQVLLLHTAPEWKTGIMQAREMRSEDAHGVMVTTIRRTVFQSADHSEYTKQICEAQLCLQSRFLTTMNFRCMPDLCIIINQMTPKW